MAVQSPSVRPIFERALELASDEERRAYLEEASAGQPELREKVEALLKAHSEAGSFLDSPAIADDATVNQDPPISEHPGTVIGPYTLLQQIGEGGMGVVFMAEQTHPVRRKVALKIIKPGMDTRQVISRFEAERQALAMMDHPNIAKVLDAGTTDAQARVGERETGRGGEPDLQASFRGSPSPPLPVSPSTSSGRPYFVMELVQGVPITEYCDQCNLTTQERLELFITVCQAVQHAHQKGIIHRDIKPTNVLVAIQDGRPAPKIIDFGVAKAIDQRLTEHTLTTAFAQMVGSPLYMSPEQAELSPLGVDTRSDIYSLGVLLYELLTSTTPFDKDRLHAASYDEMRRIIREEEPPRPSARISQIARPSWSGPSPNSDPAKMAGLCDSATLAANLATTIAEHRRTDPRRLIHTIRGELDWIVMKCLEKDRNRRYETPNSLARDVERYLHDEPVQACPPSAGYRFRKFARRNRTLLAAGGGIVASLVVGLGLSTWMYYRAATESAKARAVSDFLQNMLRTANPDESKDASYSVRQMLDDSSASMAALSGQPAVEAELRATIGRAYSRLGARDMAEPHLTRALELRRDLFGPDDESVAEMQVDMAWFRRDQSRLSDAEAAARDALRIYHKRGETGASVLKASSVLQVILTSSRHFVEAQAVTDEALALARASGAELPEMAEILQNQAYIYIEEGRYPDAEQAALQAVDMHRRLRGPGHEQTAWALYMLGTAQQKQQKLAEAEESLREALTIFRKRYRGEHHSLTSTMGSLRQVLMSRGDQSAMAALDSEEARRSANPSDDVRLAGILLKSSPTAEQKEEARRLIRRATEAFGQVPIDYPNDLDRRIHALDGYGKAIMACADVPDFANEIDELNRRHAEEIPQFLAAFPDSSDGQWWTASLYRGWAKSLYPYGNYLPTAERAFTNAIDILEKLSVAEPSKLPAVWLYLVDTYLYLGDIKWRLSGLEDAEPAYRRAIDIFAERTAELEAGTPDREYQAIVIDYLCIADFLAANERSDQAAEFVRKATQTLAAGRVTDAAQSAEACFYVGLLQLRLGDHAGYRATCKALADLPFTTASDSTKGNTILVWILAPDALADMSLVVKRAEAFAVSNSLGYHHIDLFQWGAAHLRAGDYNRAAQLLEQSIDVYPSDSPLPPGFATINWQRLFLAMTKWRQGQPDEARQLLAEAQAAIDEQLQPPSPRMEFRLYTEVLRREAEALIKPKETDEAVENKEKSSSGVEE